MIITSDNPKAPLKGAANNSQPAAGPSPPDPPPSYGVHQQTQPYHAQHVVVEQGFVYRESPERRFWRAFFVAFLIWFLLTMLAQSVVGLANWSHHGRYIVQQRWTGSYPVPSNVALGHCVSGNGWFDESLANRNISQATLPSSRFPHSAETSFDLPLSADNLFLLARGPQSYGAVNVASSSNIGDQTKVHVTVSYYDRDVLKSGAKVCLIKRKNNEIGVGIFSRHWDGNRRGPELYFETTVVFPESASDDSDKIRQIKGFQTDVPNSPHHIGDLRGLVDFQSLDIKGTNAGIYAESLYAVKGSIWTINGPIEGNFKTSRSLTLKTSNAPIKVDVKLLNNDTRATELIMRTSNNVLESDVHLISSSNAGGNYVVTSSTSNGLLRVNFPTSPVDSTLKLSAITSNSPATVSLHPAYEGSFDLSTSRLPPSILRREVDDPAGKGRKRTLDYNSISRGSIKGHVSWSETKGAGSVSVKTSNEAIYLQL